MFAFRDNHPKGLSLVVIVVLCVALALASAPRVSLADDPDAIQGEEVAEPSSSESDGGDVADETDQQVKDQVDESDGDDGSASDEVDEADGLYSPEIDVLIGDDGWQWEDPLLRPMETEDFGLQLMSSDWKSILANNYSKAKQLAGRSSFNGYCSLAVSYELWAYGITNPREAMGNGVDAAAHFSGGGTTTGGYSIAYTGGSTSAGWSPFDQATNNGTTDGIYIMSYTSTSSVYGHVSFFVLEGGAVYITESYGYSGNPEGTGMAFSYSSFKSQWSRYYPNVTGVVRFFTGPVNHDPIACFDGAEGGEGTVHVTGWAFDPDDPSASLTMHVYVGGNADSGEGHVVTANVPRQDVNNAYGIVGNHGFDVILDTSMRGYQPVVIYAINVPGSNSNPPLEVKYVTIANKESVPPVISDVQVSDVNPAGYTITCRVTDNVGVDRVQFPTWTSENGQDDLAGEWWVNSAVSGSRSGDTWTFRVNASDHNGELGAYATDIYAYDAAGNAGKYATVVANLEASTDLPEGRYYIVNNKYRDRVVDVYGSSTEDGANVLLYQKGDVTNQQFTIERNDDSSYTIVAEHSGKAIEVPGASRENGASIKQCARNGSDAQRWYAWKTDDGSWMFRNKATGYLLSIYQETSESIIDVRQSSYNYNGLVDWQEWILEEVDGRPSIALADCGEIRNHRETGSAIEPKPNLKYNGEKLVEGEDYTLSYSNNVEVGTANVRIEGINGYRGARTETFGIVPGADLATWVDVLPSRTTFTYDGTPKTLSFFKPGKPWMSDLPYPTQEPESQLGVDFTVSYENNVNAGTATCTMTGTSKRLYGTRTIEFTIVPADISGAIVSEIPDQTHMFTELRPLPTVTLNGRTLNSGSDYTLSYKNNIDVGTATITITGKGNYTGTKDVTFRIEPKISISTTTVSGITDQFYTGSRLEPAVTVKVDNTTLIAGTDYIVTYANNLDAGTATVNIIGKGDYSGTKSIAFNILPVDITDAEIAKARNQIYCTFPRQPDTTIKVGDKTLQQGTDYTLSYRDNVEVGTATLIATGKGNYTGTKETTFDIERASISRSRATPSISSTELSDQVYTGSAIEPTFRLCIDVGDYWRWEPSWYPEKDKEYTASFTDNVNVGTASVTLTGIGSCTGERRFTYKIVPADLYEATVSAIVDQVYTGKVVEPRPVVRCGGRTLVLNTDYTVTYKNNINVGTATVTVTGKGNYTGKKEATFEIAGSPAGWRRLSGEGRYDTMASIVSEGFDSSEWAVVAFGRNFPDALAAAPLAGMRDCPVVLTEGSSLSAQAREVLGGLGVRHAYVMGGTGVVSGAVEADLEAMGIEVARVAGNDRQQTSVMALRELAEAQPTTVVVATGRNYADTLSIGPWCYREAAPILLAGWDGRLTEEQVAAVRACPSVTDVVIVGGTGAVSADVEGQLAGYRVQRLAGSDRYATSALVAKWEIARGMGVSRAAVATGANFPDALAGAALCGRSGSVLLLSLDADYGTVALRDVLAPHASEVYQGYVLGGEGAVPPKTLDYLSGFTQ